MIDRNARVLKHRTCLIKKNGTEQKFYFIFSLQSRLDSHGKQPITSNIVLFAPHMDLDPISYLDMKPVLKEWRLRAIHNMAVLLKVCTADFKLNLMGKLADCLSMSSQIRNISSTDEVT